LASGRLTFPLVQRRRVVGLSYGGMHSTRRGTGSDIASSRPYHPGDDVKAIDWAASAKLSLASGTDEFIVRERYADEAPRLVVVCDRRPSMSLYEPPFPWLRKREVVDAAVKAISDSALAARAFIGYLDHGDGDGDAFWRPPRSQKELDEHVGRPNRAPHDALERAVRHLVDHRKDLPVGTFVFVLSDFLVGTDRDLWMRAAERRWDVVPVLIQDPTWEQSFPDVSGIVVPFFDPGPERVVYASLTAAEVAARRAANEERYRSILALFRSLDLEPVTLSAADPGHVINEFLSWADRRFHVRGRAM
jgi:uncharacterized protein (DUF58 family)